MDGGKIPYYYKSNKVQNKLLHGWYIYENRIVNERNCLLNNEQNINCNGRLIVKKKDIVNINTDFIHFGTYVFLTLFILSVICNGFIHSGLIRYGIICYVGHLYSSLNLM